MGKVTEDKLGLKTKNKVDVLVLRSNRNNQIVDNQKIFPGYHMNKSSWISVKLDGTLNVQEICSLIDESYQLVCSSSDWFIPTNPKMFDIISYMDHHKIVSWHKALKIHTGDFVYIYVGAPYSAILYQCKVLKVEAFDDKKNEFTMEVLQKYDKEKYSLAFLKEHGLNTVRWARNIPKELSEMLK